MSAPQGAAVRPGASLGRWAALLEVVALAGLVLSYIWFWQGAFPGHGSLVVVLYFGIGAATHLRRRETPREIGIRLDNFWPSLQAAVLWLAPIAVLGLVAGVILRSWFFPSWQASLVSLAWRVAWGTAQDYGLLCVLYRRLRELLPGERLPIVAGGLLFGLFHLPNPFLTVVTVVASGLACWIYRKHSNLFALGLVHGAISFVLTYSLPVWLTLELRVGPQILPYLTRPF